MIFAPHTLWVCIQPHIQRSRLVILCLTGVAINAFAQTSGDDTSPPGLETPGSEQQFAYAADSWGAGDDAQMGSMPEVLSTTRLRQPKSRVPGTTTVLQGKLIRDLGIANLWEAFRLVPGMTVGFVKSNRPVVSYHGTVADKQRRLQVQIDGRTAYLPSIADVDWHAMPVPVENVERIEITRGPNAAAYGINAFLATINIITRSPQDTHGVQVRLRGGTRGYRQAYGAIGDRLGNYDWRLSYSRRQSNGFGFRYINPPQSGVDSDEKINFDDSYRFNTYTYDSTLTIDKKNALDLRLGYTDVYDEEDAQQYGDDFGVQGVPAVNGDDYYLQTRWEHTFSGEHFIHFQVSYQDYNRRQRWRSCLAPGTVGNPVQLCGTTNQNSDEDRLEFEIQDTVSLTDNLRLLSGGSYRKDSFASDTYFNGDGGNYQTLLFGNLEYTPIHWLTLNAGASWEKTTSLADRFVSPRVAANFQLTDNQTLRFVLSKAVRTPDAFEQSADWGYRATDVQPESIYGAFEGQRLLEFKAPGGLKEEHIISREISYFGQFRMGSTLLSTEVKLFHDDLSDIISGLFSVSGGWDLGNYVAIEQKGAELETSLKFRQSTFRLTYAWLDQDARYQGPAQSNPDVRDRYIRLQTRLSAEHSGSVAWIQQLPWSVSTSAAYYVARDLGEYTYDRIDLRVAKSVYSPARTYKIAAVLQYYPQDEPIMYRDNNYNSQSQFFIEASVRF